MTDLTARPPDKARGSYRFNGLSAVSWGQPASDAIAEIAIRRNAQRVVIVVSPSLERQSSIARETASALAGRCAGVFDGVRPHTPAPTVDALAALLRSEGADLVATFGGGSPIDTVKVALAMVASGAERALDLAAATPALTPPPLRQICAPTTLSGAEFSDLGGVTNLDTRIKFGVAGPGIGPIEVVLDPKLTLHTPLDLWLSTGVRAVDHAVETICSIRPTPYTDALALAGLKGLSEALRAAAADPAAISPRLAAQQSVWMASSGLDRTPFGASHGIGHQLGAVAGVPHGYCSCVLLPATLDWNLPVTAEQQDRIAGVLGASSAAGGVRSLLSALGMPQRLRDVGVSRVQLDLVAQTSLQNRWVRANPRPIKAENDVMAILEAAW